MTAPLIPQPSALIPRSERERTEFTRSERDRVLARIASNLHEARRHLAQARNLCTTFGIDLDLPDDKILSAAAERCADLYHNPPEKTA
jgi:hypothetical protein